MTDPARALVEALADELAPRAGSVSPAHAWGVFDGDALVHAEGVGDAAPHPADTAFRIASCTKSFTASAALSLVDDGLLDLDEPLADALDVPLTFLGEGTPTVRDALTMRTGLPTDDPWADRQESLSDDDFGLILREGIRGVRPAGTAYEYSNLGYAIVGRIIALRSGRSYRDVVHDRLLRPLGTDATGFTEVAARGGTVTGFRPGPDGWVVCPFSGPGAFSPIGGLFSTVRDLATWVIALGRSADGHGPLPASVSLALARPATPIVGTPGSGSWSAYGMGLVVCGVDHGRPILGHSGGYPGFGAHLEWDTATAVGAVVLENATYSSPAGPVRAAMHRAIGAPAIATEPDSGSVEPWEATATAAAMLQNQIPGGTLGDPAGYDPCASLDVPFPERRAALASALASIGPVTEVTPARHPTAARVEFEVTGARGGFAVRASMTPLGEPKIQSLRIAPLR